MFRRALSLALLLSAVVAPARASTSTMSFRCDGSNGSVVAMENSYMTAVGGGPCWAHLGHHTYDLGGVYSVGAVDGSLFAVEMQLSPPIEYVDPNTAAIAFEASTDGLAWTLVQQISWPFLLGNNAIAPERQGISFAFDAAGVHARFVRIREPLSAAQGLSGYLDASAFDAAVTPVDLGEAAPWAGTRAYGCGSAVMEGIFPGHRCWFGGVDRYDAPSFFHTYPLGALEHVTAIGGHVTLLPWRTDDYTNGGGSATGIAAIVQVSADGASFTDVGTVSGRYGSSIPIALSGLGGVAARYVRIVAERNPRFNDPSAPSLKHGRGFLVDSALSVTAA